jgi:dTDP-4-dehydrorhamnose 3,5-epimerase
MNTPFGKKVEFQKNKDICTIRPKIFSDDRGFFVEIYNQNELESLGFTHVFVQDNISYSKKGVIRGLHMQSSLGVQGKLVMCLDGKIKDIFVDLRPHSPQFGKVHEFYLSSDDISQVYIPEGFAHGFSVLSEGALVLYKSTNFYDSSKEIALNPLDSFLNIDWEIEKKLQIISDKDRQGMSFEEFKRFYA